MEFVNALNFDQAIKWKEHWAEKVKKEGKGEGAFGKDASIPMKTFEAGQDNCSDNLHMAR